MIRLEHVHKQFGQQTVLNDVNIEFPAGITALLGPSGCGKTTLLRLIAGLENQDAGKILGTEQMKICYLFQEPRLLPWMTAEQNVRAVQDQSSKRTAAQWLQLVGLSGAEQKLPEELSGGMCQRVALARALAFGGDCFLLDEPFKEIDPQTKTQLFSLIREETMEKTVIFVTHVEAEAEALGDRMLFVSAQGGSLEWKENIAAQQQK